MSNLAKIYQPQAVQSPKVDWIATIEAIDLRFKQHNQRIMGLRDRIDNPSKLQPLKGAHFTLFKKLVFKYAHLINKCTKQTDLPVYKITPESEIPKRITPSMARKRDQQFLWDGILLTLSTNNVELAEDLKVSKDSIKRQIKRLIQAGFITHKVNHGRKQNYELLLSPDLYVLECRKALRVDWLKKMQPEKQGKVDSSQKSIGAKCTLPYTSTVIYNKEIQYKEKSQKSDFEFSKGERNQSQAVRLRKITGGGAAAPDSTYTEKLQALDYQQKKLLEYIKDKSVDVMTLATEQLYKKTDKTVYPGAWRKAVTIIAEKWFKGCKRPQSVDARFREYEWRIKFQSRQLEKEGAFVLEPTTYFDPNRQKGAFRGTKEYYKQHLSSEKQKQRKKTKRVAFDKLLREARLSDDLNVIKNNWYTVKRKYKEFEKQYLAAFQKDSWATALKSL